MCVCAACTTAQVCVLSVITFLRARLSEGASRWGKRERERDARTYDAAITPHAGSICTLLFVSSLGEGKKKKNGGKKGDLVSPREAADPFSAPRDDGTFCVCLLHPLTPSVAAGSAAAPPKEREKTQTNKIKMTAVSAAECE